MAVFKRILYGITLVSLLAACGPAVSDAQVQTAIAVAVMTSEGGSPQEMKELATAEAALTQQAGQIATMQAEMEVLKTSPTPTITLTPWATGTATPTDAPKYGGLPKNQKIVIANGNAPWWRKKGENNVGKPVMVKTNPVQRFENGQVFWVYKARVQADGGGYFYRVSGPSVGKGYYIAVGDVKDY